MALLVFSGKAIILLFQVSLAKTEETMEQYQGVIDYLHDIDCFNSYNGIYLTHFRDGYAQGKVKLTKNSLNPNGKVHGGLMFAMCDYIGGFVASADDRACVTQGSSFNFLRPASGEYLICKAEPVKIGSRLAIVEVSVFDDNDRLVAKGTFTYCYMTGDNA